MKVKKSDHRFIHQLTSSYDPSSILMISFFDLRFWCKFGYKNINSSLFYHFKLQISVFFAKKQN